jgi:hypothetical protein
MLIGLLLHPFALLRPELDEGSTSKGKDWKGQELSCLEFVEGS